MPIIHFINNKTQTAGGMRNVLAYVSRKEKTVSEDKHFVTGVNCSPETALAEMNATKNLYHKHDGRLTLFRSPNQPDCLMNPLYLESQSLMQSR